MCRESETHYIAKQTPTYLRISCMCAGICESCSVVHMYRWFNGSHLGMELCLVLDGHDGEKAADFARLHLPGQLLAQRLTGGPQAVFLAIGTAFKETEKQYFMALDDALTRKLSLQSEINVSNVHV